MNLQKVDFHSFVDVNLAEKGFTIEHITKDLMDSRVDDFMNFVNSIRTEYTSLYGWTGEKKEYFLNPLNNKWEYSFTILNSKNEICFVNFSSIYDNIIHNHCTYAGKQTRGLGFAKLHMVKLCQAGLDSGFTHQEGYWPMNNNRSIILFLNMGWQIENIRNEKDLFMKADLQKVRDKTYELVLANK